MTQLEADWLKSRQVQEVLDVLADGGYQAFVVGGAVRNALLGLAVTDLDIATSARPEQVIDLAERAGIRAVPTGIEHGTVTLIVGDTPFEVTTFRRDIETDGRRAVVAFSDTVEEDAARRDFTLNALYADASGRVLDPVGGMADLRARRIVFVGDPDTRIKEDFLRSLRFFRFTAQYGDPDQGLDPDALAAIADNLEGLESLARERIGAEMIKLLGAKDPGPAIAAMQITGVLIRLLPGAVADMVFPLVHLEGDAGRSPDWVRRLAALGGEDPAERLRLPKKAARRLDILLAGLSSTASLAEIAWREGEDVAWDVALLRSAGLGAPMPDSVGAEVALGASVEFPLSAQDLMPDHEGPALGAALKSAERLWIDSGFKLDRDALLLVLGKAG